MNIVISLLVMSLVALAFLVMILNTRLNILTADHDFNAGFIDNLAATVGYPKEWHRQAFPTQYAALQHVAHIYTDMIAWEANENLKWSEHRDLEFILYHYALHDNRQWAARCVGHFAQRLHGDYQPQIVDPEAERTALEALQKHREALRDVDLVLKNADRFRSENQG